MVGNLITLGWACWLLNAKSMLIWSTTRNGPARGGTGLPPPNQWHFAGDRIGENLQLGRTLDRPTTTGDEAVQAIMEGWCQRTASGAVTRKDSRRVWKACGSCRSAWVGSDVTGPRT